MDDPPKIPAPDDMSYEAAEWNMLRQSLRMTFAERLEWVDEMERLAEKLQEQPPGEEPDEELRTDRRG